MRTRVLLPSLLAFLLSLGLAVSLNTALALAAAPHTFDPTLSLTGGCTTSKLDLVPDPPIANCPSGAHPPNSFTFPTGVTTDSYGNIYVASHGNQEAKAGRIDVFDSKGLFITELLEPSGPRTIAVDSEGFLYVASWEPGGSKLQRYSPSMYNPAAGELAYNPAPILLSEPASDYSAMAINPENDHLFVNFGSPYLSLGALVEYGSAKEGNPVLDPSVAEYSSFDGPGLAIDAAHDRIYATDQHETDPALVGVFELAPPHDLIKTIDGSSTPEGAFLSDHVSLAVDEATGNVYAYEQVASNTVYELSKEGQYLSSFQHGFQEGKQSIAVDNGANSPNGALNPAGRYLWVTSAPSGVGHAYAFGPATESPPTVESVSFDDVGEEEALLQANVDPGQLQTSYTFEYVSRTQFDETGFTEASKAGEGTIPPLGEAVEVSAEAAGLSPGTEYVFRIIATNELGSDEAEGAFKTYPAIPELSCPNGAFRFGASAALPDCRAYELVTPGDTNARAPLGSGFLGPRFPTRPVSPDGNRVPFRIEGGLIPGSNGTGSLAGDPYLATRGPNGWNSVQAGGTGSEATAVLPGARSPDQAYSVWVASGQGPAIVDGDSTTYVRHPDGHSELLGQGSIADDPHAVPKLISENGSHIVFTSSAHLEEEASAKGNLAVYDRTSDGISHVASLLPPGDVTPSGEQTVNYRGASLDGRGIAFAVFEPGKNTLYLRYGGETYDIGDDLTFEGVAEGGKRIFYLEGGSLFAFDVEGGTIPFVTSGNAIVVNVSADGSAAYFVSPTKLTSVANPLGSKAKAGQENLYLSREGSISFVGIINKADVVGEAGKNVKVNGLGLWDFAVGETSANPPGGFGSDPSRTTHDGSVLLFQASADLTEYDSAGDRQIYRYDATASELTCLSCNPTGAPAAGGASLQDVSQDFQLPEPNTNYDVVDNLSTNGRRAFFQSLEPLVSADTDGLQDVYEWEAQGVGSCNEPSGCVYLISSGHSAKTNYLYAASDTGDDVFIRTSDLLLGIDVDETPSIYDARVGGGFPEPAGQGCHGEGCRPALLPVPLLPTPGGTPSGKSGNPALKCPKGKRRVKRKGKVRCVKKAQKHASKRHRRASKKEAGK